jgi:hypothetical protein
VLWRPIVDKDGIACAATPTPMSFNKLCRSTPGGTALAGPVSQGDCRLNGWSPKPSNRDHPPLFRELHVLKAQQHVA